MDNPEKLATQGTQDEEKQNKTQNNTCRTPLYTFYSMYTWIVYYNTML
jgi:hypothetical protein